MLSLPLWTGHSGPHNLACAIRPYTLGKPAQRGNAHDEITGFSAADSRLYTN